MVLKPEFLFSLGDRSTLPIKTTKPSHSECSPASGNQRTRRPTPARPRSYAQSTGTAPSRPDPVTCDESDTRSSAESPQGTCSAREDINSSISTKALTMKLAIIAMVPMLVLGIQSVLGQKKVLGHSYRSTDCSGDANGEFVEGDITLAYFSRSLKISKSGVVFTDEACTQNQKPIVVNGCTSYGGPVINCLETA
ncbi:unnamed protein product [Sympodiomycopsis kandeliae]